MGQQITALREAIQTLAESCHSESPKQMLGDPNATPTPSGNTKPPDTVFSSGGRLLFDINSFLGSSDSHGKQVRITCLLTGQHQDVVSTWLPGPGDPANDFNTGKNQVTTRLLGQTAPGSLNKDHYSIDDLNAHGQAWETEGNPVKPKVTTGAEIEGIGVYLEGTVVAKLNELIGQFNQLRTDYDNGVVPTTATAVSTLPV